MNHQPPDYEYKYGHSEILKDVLFLGGEDDVDHLLYGEEARHLNTKGVHINPLKPSVDVWIDLRDVRSSNRLIYVPDTILHLSIPFHDGNLTEARESLPIALEALKLHLNSERRVLVTCHQGRSRSVMLLLWYLAEIQNSYLDAYWLIKGARPIIEPDKNFLPLIEEWKNQYPGEKGLW